MKIIFLFAYKVALCSYNASPILEIISFFWLINQILLVLIFFLDDRLKLIFNVFKI